MSFLAAGPPRGRILALAVLTAAFALASSLLPREAAGGRPSSGATACPLPATDLCTSYSFRGRVWRASPVRYYVNDAGAPPGFAADVQDAFATWENELKSPAVEAAYPGDRSTLDFSYEGVTSVSEARRDGISTVSFRPAGDGIAGTSVYTSGGKIVEFDIVLNSGRAWATDLTCPAHDCGALDVQNVTTHEVGHTIDLYHVTAAGDALLTMHSAPADGSTSYANETAKRDLGAGDVLGLRRAYPQP